MATMAGSVSMLYRSTIGKKVIMAITGIIGYGFVIGHMIGNLKIFLGQQAFNDYALFLRTVGEPVLPYSVLLWIVRLVLIAAVILHVTMAVQLTRIDWAGRPVSYAQKRPVQASFASMTLRWGGLVLVLFIIYHLMHLTWGWVNPGFSEGDAYHNVVFGFQNVIIVLFYVLAMGALAMHMYHGVWSMFQTLGLNNPRTNSLWRGLAVLSAIVLFVGFTAVPVAVVTGMVR